MTCRLGAQLCATTLLVSVACGGDDGGSDGGADTSPASTSADDDGSDSGTIGVVESSSGAVDSTSTDAATSEGGTTGGVCADEQPAIVTDIDETLTLSDEEFLMQLMDGNYDPVEREGGAALIGGYADLGYRIMYLTARSETFMTMGTNETAREATERWLEEHGYPMDPSTTTLVLSPNVVVGDTAQTFKAGALMEQQAAGWRFDYAYGNATSDIGAYADAGIDVAATFIIGEHAGEGGTVAIEGEGWVEHTAEQLPMVPAVCEAA